MRHVIVRYKIKPERVAENVALVERVFAQLAREQPGGLRYTTYRCDGDDGATFVHVATVEDAAGKNPLLAVAAFQDFTAAIKDRCIEPPVTLQAEIVGQYPPPRG